MGFLASIASLPFVFALAILGFVTVARIGLVATITSVFVFGVLRSFPFTWPPTAWYSGVGFVGLAVTTAIAIAAFYVATGADQRARPPARAPGDMLTNEIS